MRCRELKVVPMDKLRRRLMRRRLVAGIALRAAALIALGILVVLVIMMVTGPYKAAAETLPAEAVGTPVVLRVTEEEAETESEPAQETVSETETVAETVPEMEYIGTFTLTAYCNCSICCGKWAGGPTASGVMPTAGRTIAVDKSVIPLGSKVYIEGFGEYVAEDTGSAIKGNRIDVYMDSHEVARWFANGAGKCNAKVWIIKEEDENNEDF